MKKQILFVILGAALAAGCASTRQKMGATGENDQNVLTGGPVTGTTINDLPQPVKNTLQERVPTAEISDIDKQNRNSRYVYKIQFIDNKKYPTMYITEDGGIESPPPQ
jgi:hypothetical protein